MDIKQHAYFYAHSTVQELCESRGGRPVFSVLMSLLVSVDIKQYWTMLMHWSQLVPNMSIDICGHEALFHHHAHSEHRFPTMYTLAKRGWGEGWVGTDIKAYLRWVSVPARAFVSEGWGGGLISTAGSRNVLGWCYLSMFPEWLWWSMADFVCLFVCFSCKALSYCRLQIY